MITKFLSHSSNDKSATRRYLPLYTVPLQSLMDRLWLSVSGIEDYHHFNDRCYSSVELVQELDNRKCEYTFGFITLCPCCTNFSGKTVHLVARQAFKTPDNLAAEIFLNVTTGKG
jgi:hypothetical protein